MAGTYSQMYIHIIFAVMKTIFEIFILNQTSGRSYVYRKDAQVAGCDSGRSRISVQCIDF